MKSRNKSLGFTLVELLVVMSLMSLVMLALFSAMRSMGQVEARIDARLARSDELRSADTFLRFALGRASTQKMTGLQPGVSQLPFMAQPESVMWVGVMPARYGAGGRHFFRLGAEPSQQGQTALVLRFTPWINNAEPPNWAASQALVLAQTLTSLGIRYLDTAKASFTWRNDWPFNDRLPVAVDLAVVTNHESWPDLIIAMRALPGSSDVTGSITAGPDR